MLKNWLIFSLLIFSILYVDLIADDSPCGDWQPFKEDKCIKIFEKIGLQTYSDAENICEQQESSLISIRYQEEQEFIANFFKINKIPNDVWIGVKYISNKYKLNDDTDLVYANWAQGSPKNQIDHCVQFLSDESLFGKWSDVVCNRKNLVACEKMQIWSPIHLQKLLLNTIKNPVPVGFIYVQLPNKISPNAMWPWMTWKDVSSAYSGLFFRAEGGGSEAFGTIQADNSPRLTNVQDIGSHVDSGADVVPGIWSQYVFTGKNENPGVSLRFLVSGGEVRPRNTAIRIWERTA